MLLSFFILSGTLCNYGSDSSDLYEKYKYGHIYQNILTSTVHCISIGL